MPLTANQIRDRVANDLGILPLGQSLQSQDAARISQAYNEVYADLKSDGLATWASTSSVPDDLAPNVIALTSMNCVGDYAVPIDRYNRIIIRAGENGATAKANIRRLITPKLNFSQEEPQNF